MDFSGRFLLSMIQFASIRGANHDQMITMTGYDLDFLGNEENRISPEIYNRVIEHCVRVTKDELFGFHAGEYLNLAAAGLIGQISQTSSTVKEALQYCCEFASLGCQALPLNLEKTNQGYRLDIVPDKEWELSSKIAVRQTLEGAMAFTLREFHLLTIQKYFPLEVGFTSKQDSSHSEFERLFKCPVKYEQSKSYLLFSTAQVETKVITSDFNLLRILVGHAEEKLQKMSAEEGVFSQVRRAVINLSEPSFPIIETVAANMNLSVRSLQRKLAAESKTYKMVIESLRKEMAIKYLNQNTLNVQEVSELLGYSDVSSFSRSFKKWTSLSPTAYRQSC